MTDADPWLTPEQQDAWRQYLRGYRALEVALDGDLVTLGMSLAEYEILSMLSEADGQRMRMGVLADVVVQSRSRITHTAKRLETRGWVAREACKGDARGVELVLTEEGMAALVPASRLHAAGVRRYLIDVMPPEQFLSLGDAMRRVHERIDALDD